MNVNIRWWCWGDKTVGTRWVRSGEPATTHPLGRQQHGTRKQAKRRRSSRRRRRRRMKRGRKEEWKRCRLHPKLTKVTQKPHNNFTFSSCSHFHYFLGPFPPTGPSADCPWMPLIAPGVALGGVTSLDVAFHHPGESLRKAPRSLCP